MSGGGPEEFVTLPKGGGALRGIGEGFAPNLQTGTGNFSVPLSLPPGRNGLAPQLQLAYSSGAGNGHFGMGWSLSVGEVSRKTSRGIPRYDDAADTFVLAGADDLVPVDGGGGCAQRYRPRSESAFSRIEHIRGAVDDYWRVWRTSGAVELYGTPGAAGNDPAVRRDPARVDHVFAWRLSESA